MSNGSIVAACPGCLGGKSTFEWRSKNGEYGAVERVLPRTQDEQVVETYRLFRCAACGRGAIGKVVHNYPAPYPGARRTLVFFYPEAIEPLPLPASVPEGIATEFREGEKCLGADCVRAAAGMFRSVLDKTLRANGYKTERRESLAAQIDAAAADRVITEARKKRAHDEIRVLGNDVLHDDWISIPKEDVEAARHYAQRILEDFYDDRNSILSLLRSAGRIPNEDRPKSNPPSK